MVFPTSPERSSTLPISNHSLRVQRAGSRGRRPKYMQAREPLDYQQLVEEVQSLCIEAYEPNSIRVALSARRCLEYFIDEYRGSRPDMFWQADNEKGLSMRSSLHNELSLMMWAAWMVRIGLSASTASTYLSMARSTIEAQIGHSLTNREHSVRLPRMLRKLRKMFSCVRRKRLGWRAHHHRQLARLRGTPQGEAATTADAVLCTAREGLARCCELGPKQGQSFDTTRHPTLGDLSRHESRHGRHLVLRLLPAKKPPGQTAKVPVPLPEASGEEVGAYAAIERMLRTRLGHAVTWGDDGRLAGVDLEAPLFAIDGVAVTAAHMVQYFSQAAADIGVTGGPVSGHSGRIGGATDHFAQETPPAVLQICGRWDSDLWQVYTRQCIDQTIEYTVRASACADASLEEIFDEYTQPAVTTHF